LEVSALPLPHPAARLVGIAVVEVAALLLRLPSKVGYWTKVWNGTVSVVQVDETVTSRGVTVTGCVIVEPAEDTETVAVFVTTVVLTGGWT
jgi:F0F1-type ATP synthase beta subunit